VSSGALEGRIDAQFYVESAKLVNFTKLKDIVKVKGGKRIPKGGSYADTETDYWYLKVDDIGKFGEIDFQSIRHITKEMFEFLEHYEFEVNNLAISNAGTIGKIVLLDKVPEKRIILTENCAKLVLKTQNVLPEFLKIVLQMPLVQKQMKLAYIQTTIPKLGLERIENLKLPPIPPLPTQAQIVEKFNLAYQSKQAKEQQARELSASIDAYLLEKLGIQNPQGFENLAGLKRHFMVGFSQVQGGRFDPFYHQKSFEENITVVKTSLYNPQPLKKLVQKLVKGKLPKDEEKQGVCKVVQINTIHENGNIDTTDLLTAKEIFTEEQKMFKNDVLVVITGATIGKVAFWDSEEEGYFLGGDIVKFQCLEGVNPYFVFAWLRSKNSQIEIKRNVTGATNGHLSPYDVGNILIPLPPLSVQTEIAEHISGVRRQAKALEAEARAEIERAKAEVERLILGE
jgi:restriction endonuclease S subunit